MPDYARQLHMTRSRHRVKLPRRAVAPGYHYEEFASSKLRAERLATLRTLNIADGVNKFTNQRDGEMVFVLAIPRGAK